MTTFVKVSIYILNVIMILIGLFLVFLYIKSKELHNYSFYNIITMSLIILLDNILRLIPANSMPTFFHYLQAFLLVFFDKMILSILSTQIVVIYIIIMWVETYINNEKRIFIIGFVVCLVISAILTTIYISLSEEHIIYTGSYYYTADDWGGKLICDVVYNAILIGVNFFCIAVVLAYFSKKKQAVEAGIIEDLGYKKQYIRFLIIFFINILYIIEIFLIIYDKLPGNIDFIYLCSCLVIDLGYSINSTVIRGIKKIFCKNKISEIDNNQNTLIKKNTFGEVSPDDDDEIYEDD